MTSREGDTSEGLQNLGIKSFVSVEIRERFIKHYEKTLNITKACKLSRVTPYMIRKEMVNNPFFAAKVQEIMDEAMDELEELQMESAKTKSDDRRWVLERARPDKWGAKRRVETLNVNVNTVKEMTDEELERIIAKNAVEAEYDVEEQGGPEGSGP